MEKGLLAFDEDRRKKAEDRVVSEVGKLAHHTYSKAFFWK